MYEIIPTILTTDIKDFSQKLELVCGVGSRVQFDIIDGKFASTKTVDLSIIANMPELEKIKTDLHLMVDEPEGWINRCLETVPDRIIAQVEKMTSPWDFVNEVIESGTQVGLALDLETPVDFISEDIYLLADMVLLLGVKAGEGGQEFDPRVFEKIKKVKEILGDFAKIGVDGGINEKNIKACQQAGANIFYVGNYLWEAENFQERYNKLSGLIK